ncbi:valine--tRNA ligase [Lentimicrobium sp.]
MNIPAKYDPRGIEDKWYQYWLDKHFFRSVPDDREPYTIVIPPPNVTGVLHMGHMLNNTIQDVLVRRARMQGFNTCWLPGTDHASIATEARVVAMLREQGIEKKNLTREAFLEHAWQWKEKHGGIILEQLKKLGASCDWERTRFTMDPSMYESVIDVFIDLYKKGLIYRGVRMVNWDPKALTALSDEEVVYKEVKSKLYYVRYKVEGTQDEWVTVATTRPETILGDTAVCFHPQDERYTHLVGKRVLIPLLKKAIPLIQDDYVDMTFGTGCLKITPAHDINDYTIGLKHNLESIDIFNDDSTLNEKARLYVGLDRFEVRERIVEDLLNHGHILKIEDYTNNVGFSERTDAVIEPKLSVQWFLKMTGLAKPALDVVMNDIIHFHPEKFKNTYRHWMENVHDWCISRQLWWGQRIPAWYLPSGQVVVARNAAEALVTARQLTGNPAILEKDLKQDEDVLDTWFSSWLWPISVFDGIRNPDNPDIKYYYPTNDLVTAPEILFFWVARMIMAGLEYQQEIPFKNVYLTGIVRDKLGRKMSKSLGNSPDPLDLIDQYGADGVRVGMLLTSPAGNDLPFDQSLCEQGRNFSNKIWNALRLVKGWEVNGQLRQPDYAVFAVDWFEQRFNEALSQIEDHFAKYRLSDALMTAYKLVWDDFCSWYLEIIKPAYQQPIDAITLEATIAFYEKLMQVLHPFVPFITEEIWHILRKRSDGESIMISRMPTARAYEQHVLDQFEHTAQVVNALRNFRKEKNLPLKEILELFVKNDALLDEAAAVVIKLANLSEIRVVDEIPESATAIVVKSSEYFIPLSGNRDLEAEKEKIVKELDYTRGFLNAVMRKLSNEKFISNAKPEIIENERKKQADAQLRIELLESQLNSL